VWRTATVFWTMYCKPSRLCIQLIGSVYASLPRVSECDVCLVKGGGGGSSFMWVDYSRVDHGARLYEQWEAWITSDDKVLLLVDGFREKL
jgi:hypothetical protein